MSFLEKFKKNIGVEENSLTETAEDKKNKKVEVKPLVEKKKKPSTVSKNETKEDKPSPAKKTGWFEQKGELAVDVYQTDDDLVAQSAIAGVDPDSLNIVIENDILTIEGKREEPNKEEKKNYFYQECYWGPFFKRLILQEEVDNSRVEAIMKEGILIVRIPKIEKRKRRKVKVKEED